MSCMLLLPLEPLTYNLLKFRKTMTTDTGPVTLKRAM